MIKTNIKSGGALIAMSGGVDSSVAAFIVKNRGYDCIGAMMKLYDNGDIDVPRERGCCSLNDANDARSVAEKLNMPFYVFNFSDDFKHTVIEPFITAYLNGETPNPCLDCNRHLKFERFLRRAKELEKDYIVTGHYAKIGFNAASGRYLLKKGTDLSKDQSYVLYTMTQEQLKHTLFPLGELPKSQVRKIAEEQGFINAKKQDSQDICFVPDGRYADFIRKNTNSEIPKGNFIDINGNVVGTHGGIINYTIGQRKGLGLSLKNTAPLYVCGISTKDNSVIVGGSEDLYTKTLTAKNINLIAVEQLTSPIKAKAKIRYSQSEQPATVQQLDKGTLHVEFDSPQRAITKGQAVVLYDGDTVIGGGTIV